MYTKQQLEQIRAKALKVEKILFIISMVCFGVATALFATFIALYVSKIDVLLIPDLLTLEYTLQNLLADLMSTFVTAGIVLIILSKVVFRRRAITAKIMIERMDATRDFQARSWNSKPSGTPDIVDVKPAGPTYGKYEGIIHEYEKLYEQGLITKEDLENKKKELAQ